VLRISNVYILHKKSESHKLNWEEIERLFNQEWVELVDYEWIDTETHPRFGVVRVHAKSRKEFDELILNDPPERSALVYVGKPPRMPGVILSTNLHRIESVDA